MQVAFGVLGPVTAWRDGAELALRGPRHRAVLARLIIARGRIVPVNSLVDDLWTVPPDGATSSVRTFVAALRRALEPDRPPRTPPALLITEGPGYALKATDVDAWRFEQSLEESATRPPQDALAMLEAAVAQWRGPAYAEFADAVWAHAERSRLAELRLTAIERQAEARLALGLAADAVPALDAHVAEHPWREDAWRLLALALYRSGRQGDALAVLRKARTLLVEQLGVDPGPALQRLETDILNQADHLDPHAAGQVWAQATAAYDRAVSSTARARLESTVGLLRNLAVTGGSGLEAAREHRLAAITAAEELGDPNLTARVIGLYDVPAIWTRSDDQRQADEIVAAAERALSATTQEAARARLLATVAVESRGRNSTRGLAAAREAVEISRRLEDPALLAFALNGLFMQTFYRAGLAPERDQIGSELITLAGRHDLTTYEVLGHLIRLQALSALGDFAAADAQAQAADELAERFELPLVAVFTTWYLAMRAADETAYRRAATLLDTAGMPGLADGLLPLALQSLGSGGSAATPRPGLLLEAQWCLVARQAIEQDDLPTMRDALAALTPAAGQLAAGSGLVNFGPIDGYLAELSRRLSN
ncbi:AfsR/SARP family transcriptional regulator [Kribbella sp. CA-293567]|uniref:AfsR/SARP family transcriptional regulator n=1 Tax=Kribbella sp. CA-293567 TaxID=3002436 RepID=UPI0022DE96BE|nr:AfsR/SARP family transcriptional regulator [Kribbella sp. CA-293567]WBQ04799.1 AfsR/SARP family transcriptional regulator [Kribbella sp. CA-293567]